MSVLGDNIKHPSPELPPISFNNDNWEEQKLTVAYSETINSTPVDYEYQNIFNRFIKKLKSSEHHLTEDHPIYNEEKAYVTCSKIIGYEIGVNNPKTPLLGSFLYSFIRLKYRDHLWAKGMGIGQRLSNTSYAKAIDYKDQFSTIYQNFLTTYDIWITPVSAMEAYKHQKAGNPFVINNQKLAYTKAIASFVFTTAFSGHPIVVIPIGMLKNGMPVGVQIHAKKWDDKKLLLIAKHLESFAEVITKPDLKNIPI